MSNCHSTLVTALACLFATQSGCVSKRYEGKTIDAWIEDLDQEDERSSTAYHVLKDIGSDAEPQLVNRMRSGLEDGGELNRFVIWLLLPFCPTSDVAREVFYEALSSDDYAIRSSAFEMLARPGEVDNEELLVEGLKHDSKYVRFAAAVLLCGDFSRIIEGGKRNHPRKDIIEIATPVLHEATEDQDMKVQYSVPVSVGYRKSGRTERTSISGKSEQQISALATSALAHIRSIQYWREPSSYRLPQEVGQAVSPAVSPGDPAGVGAAAKGPTGVGAGGPNQSVKDAVPGEQK